MLKQYYTREYLYDEGDIHTGFVLTSDAVSNFHFCKAEDEEEIEDVLSGCMINFGDHDDRIKEITFNHLRKLLRGEKDSWVITQINPRPGELRVEIEVPELKRLSNYHLERYFPKKVHQEIEEVLDSWYGGEMTLDFSYLDSSQEIRFHKENRRGVVEEYQFRIHSSNE